MDEAAILSLVKATLGYRSTVRDELLKTIIGAVIAELEDTIGIGLNPESNEHIMFIVDLVAFRYKNQGGETMPRNLEYRLRNLIIKYRGKKDVG
jgi:Phage QLRG family, putative DNA packaging.